MTWNELAQRIRSMPTSLREKEVVVHLSEQDNEVPAQELIWDEKAGWKYPVIYCD